MKEQTSIWEKKHFFVDVGSAFDRVPTLFHFFETMRVGGILQTNRICKLNENCSL